MMHQTYNDGNIAITSQVVNNGNDGIIAIKSKDGATIEELQFSMLEEKRLIKKCHLVNKGVSIEIGYAHYRKDKVMLRFSNEGIEFGYQGIKSLELRCF